ncbi:tetraacyldisaccharide 4'-kinase [Candidatus Pelagibacter bacterium nBUS_44]|uniref:tetraacyldisaccharide 4'-kinase n=1 Tax=Candidatus Pelagibacter bacterium nBUS_44 TaxID=3374195 RepID=UPI003EBE71C4
MNLKKPKFWDFKKPSILAYLLLPISYLFKLIRLFKIESNIKKSKIKTICVGNIYLGGTGKTSLSIKINEILTEKKIKSCFVKKFYSTQFDEQKLLESRGKLFTSSKRIDAINIAENEGYDVAILDDGLQDSSINYDLRFVCFNNINWIGNGFTIPAGPLRESINNLKNYKHIFLNGNLENLDNIKKHIYKINPNINLYIGKYIPLDIEKFNKDKNYLVFSGIGNHQTFISMLREYKFNVVKDIEFPDHYKYNNFDINKIQKLSDNLNCQIITTEKDYLRLDKEKIHNINFIKSELKILDEEKLISTILNKNENN